MTIVTLAIILSGTRRFGVSQRIYNIMFRPLDRDAYNRKSEIHYIIRGRGRANV